MQLKDYEIPKERIPLPGKAVNGEKPFFEVRGLGLDDLTLLIHLHLGPITKAVKLYQEQKEDVLATGNLSEFIMTLARDFPALVAEVISAAADSLDDETREKARKLPLPTQLAAMSEITKLTMEEVGGLKNLLAEMRERLESLAGVESELRALARPSKK